MRWMSSAAAAALLLVAACGPDAAPSGDAESAASETAAPAATDFDAAANLAASESWLEENSTKEGVEVTASGLQYKILESGPEDGETPYPGQFVCVHYAGTLIDGTPFDSSYARGEPAAFPSNRLIPGWVEALQMMRPGDKWELYIHPDLAYGDEPRGDVIRPNDALLFTVEMVRLLDGPPLPGTDCSQE
jgi:FKBP-type peptidyl-prolyl cis-trans isomerase